MLEKRIAVCHPGKIGDALYALPTARYLAERFQTKVDFYTSSYCEPLRRLFGYQSYIEQMIVPPQYQIANAIRGIQPWHIPVEEQEYQAVFQVGFRTTPNKPLPDFIAESVEAPLGLPVRYEYPEVVTIKQPYIVAAPGYDPHVRQTVLNLVRRSPMPAVIIGKVGEYIGGGIDLTGLDLLETLGWLAHARAFVGTMSSPLVLANGFSIPKVVIHDGKSFDMRHVLQSPLHHYLVNPSATEVLEALGFITLSKSLHPRDYEWLGEAQAIKDTCELLSDTPYRFDHQHRLWEYGIALRALTRARARTVLEVGGGGSIFAAAAARCGMEILQVDPVDCSQWSELQARKLGAKMTYVAQDFLVFQTRERFDAVTCLSVIEHVINDRQFLVKLLDHVKPGGILVLTTDFHPSAQRLVDGHLRTYSPASITLLANLARTAGFDYFGGAPSYTCNGEHVNNYNFAALCMRRVF